MTQLQASGGAHSLSAPLRVVNVSRTALKRTKTRLQFTGWLPYIPPTIAAVVFLGISGIGQLIGSWQIPLFWLPFGIGIVLLATAAFDVITVKVGLRPCEAVPPRRAELDAFAILRSRRSCRSYQSRELTDAHREELMAAIREHIQPDRLIGTSPIRLEYMSAPLTTWPTVGAHEFIVAIAPREYDRVSIIDVGRSLQKVVLHATRIGVDTCWIGPGARPTTIAAHLGSRFDPDRDRVICVCAVGYRSRFKPLTIRLIQRSQSGRLALTSLFFADSRLQQPLAVDAPPFASFRPTYEGCQWAPSAFNGQTTRGVAVTDDTGQVMKRLDFFATTPSRFYAPVAVGIWCANWETGCDALGIPGNFQVLTPEERGEPDAPELPRYHVSWIVKTTDAVAA
jgi:Putative TM nitroreductase